MNGSLPLSTLHYRPRDDPHLNEPPVNDLRGYPIALRCRMPLVPTGHRLRTRILGRHLTDQIHERITPPAQVADQRLCPRPVIFSNLTNIIGM